MYSDYLNFVNTITDATIINSSFKSNHNYMGILEHVSKSQGNDYCKLVNELTKSLFPELTTEHINGFIAINDKFGNPEKHNLQLSNTTINCSPSSLRYIYHSLLVLDYYRKIEQPTCMVEVGCGYGGLFLAINYFANILNIQINHYYFIDLPEICSLIKNYLSLHRGKINISYSVHSAYNYGREIDTKDLFLISNYCFTEIEKEHRDQYIELLFPKTSSGFIIWQTIAGLPITDTYILNKKIVKVTEERPQTANQIFKNYFVYY
jgi:hypothetical protein